MNHRNADRWGPIAGVLFSILFAVSFFLTGTETPPGTDASAGEIVAFLEDESTAVAISGVLGGVMLVLFLWFLASFAGAFREAGDRRHSTIMYGAGVAGVTIAAVGDVTYVSVGALRTTLDEASVQAIYLTGFYVYHKLFWACAALALATALANMGTRLFASWFSWLSFLAAAVFVLSGSAVGKSGFFGPMGVTGAGFLAFLLLVLVASILLLRRPAEAAAPMAAPPAAATH